ncbi:MAG: sugar transferase [Gammaproteobacteria bacterium]|nr:sugar transferase [Gammaproteobacteria bacterium]
MYDEKSKYIGKLLYLLDGLLTLFALILANWVSYYFLKQDNPELFYNLAVFIVLWVPLGYFLFRFGAYDGLRILSLPTFAWRVSKALGISLGILVTLLFLLNANFLSRSVFMIFAAIELTALVGIRAILYWWYFQRFVQKGENYLKVVIIGTGDRAARLARGLHKKMEWGVHIVGYLDTEDDKTGREIEGSPVLGTVDKISEILTSQVIDEVIMAVPRSMISDLEGVVSACEEQGVTFRWMADMFDLRVARMRLVQCCDIPILTFEPVAQSETKLLVKRMFDLLLVFLTLPIILPVMLLISIAIKLDSPGPVFFVQKRVGLNKRIFPLLKFRSMYIDADKKIKSMEHLNEADGPIFKIKNDPRITRVGKLIRKTSMDELPQLFNVIRGQMSLVGPRPMSIRDVDLFDKGIQRKRFSVLPGITCIWQVSGRSNLSFEKWLELDIEYIDNWSLSLDLQILLKTVPAVVRGNGAT